MDLLRESLAPFVREQVVDLKAVSDRLDDTIRRFMSDQRLANKPILDWDVAGLLKLMMATWNDVFRGDMLGHIERSLVSELYEWRNKWAHQEAFSSEGYTPLMWAKSAAATKMLLAAGASVDARTPRGETALMWVVSGNRVPTEASEIACLLLRAGADPNATDRSGRTALA